MIPEVPIKSKVHIELASLIATRNQLVKLRVSLLNKAHGLFVKNGLKGEERKPDYKNWF